MNEKRTRDRVKFVSSIEIETGRDKIYFEDLRDVSMSGFFIKTDKTFIRNKVYKFNLKLECGDKQINIIGKATPIRSMPGEDKKEGVGFKITYLEPESSEELYNVIKFNRIE